MKDLQITKERRKVIARPVKLPIEERRQRYLASLRKYRESEHGKAKRKSYQYTEQYREYHREYYQRNWLKFALRGMEKRCKEKGLEFSIGPEDIVIPNTCPILGLVLEKNKGGRKDNSPSIDRIDNSKGYTKDNISVISLKANRCKQDLTIEQVEKLLKYMKKEI